MTYSHIPLGASSWVLRPRPLRDARLRIFCFPYAGASAAIFRSWCEQLPPGIELCLVQLPGRGSKLLEQPFTQVSSLIHQLSHALVPFLNIPFALFGHSMGALISFELARQLRWQYRLNPTHLFASGFRAPQLPDAGAPIYHLPEPDFLAALRRFGGTPESIFENAEVMQLITPMLRADVTLCETYEYVNETPLDCPITAFGGWQDRLVTVEQIAAWREQTHNGFSMHMFEGDHFFINTARPQLLCAIFAALEKMIARVPESQCV